MRGSSMADLGARNERIVLEAIRSAPDGSSQSEVIDRSGLSRQAVSLITRRLLDRGLVETAGTRGAGRGKPRTVLRVVPSSLLAAGVHLDPVAITVVITDLASRVVAERSLGAPGTDPAADVARIAAALEELLAELDGAEGTPSPPRPAAEILLGIGVAAPGGLDVGRGLVLSPPWLPGWTDVPLTDLLTAATGFPAVLDKDTNAALTAETWAAGPTAAGPGGTGDAADARDAGDAETVLYVYVGAGVGSAVSSGGRLHPGSTTQAGEIGHLPTGLPGPECPGCGRLACLSQSTDIAGILDRARALGLDALSATDHRDGLRQLAELAEAGEDHARALLEGHGVALGEALRTLIGVHDPSLILIGGPSWRLLEPFALPPLRERALRAGGDDHGVRIAVSAIGDDVAAIGAAALYLSRELSPLRR